MSIKILNNDEKKWFLETKNTVYVIGVDENKNIQHLYWGEKLPYPSDYPGVLLLKESIFDNFEQIIKEEFSPWGGIRYKEPGLKVIYEDHVRDLILKYKTYKLIDSDKCKTLIIYLIDSAYNLEVELNYRLIEEYDLIERWVNIKNKGSQSVQIKQILSAQWHLPDMQNYRLSYLYGRWAGETKLSRIELGYGKKIFESRRGITSHQFNPWFAVDNGQADEDIGKVYYGILGWSGNWKIVFEKDSYGRLQIGGGINDFDFSWQLKPNECFVTPKFVAGHTTNGFGDASRKLHHYQLDYILPGNLNYKTRPVLYNSWEATKFNVNEEGQKILAERVASLGVELFVLDDGWFGERNDDTDGLGDWYVNKKKFPHDLTSLISYVNELGMDFGLWVEPEMVNKNSKLYNLHPDWVYHFPNRPRSESRNQLVLNLAKKEVVEYIYDFINKLLDNYNIKFIKWDMNRPFSEPGWPEALKPQQQEIWVRHVQGLYQVLDRLRRKYPEVIFESCSGGGGRVDLGILQRTDQVWVSDNTDAFDRLKIQEGFSYAYTPKIMMSWVTDSPNWLNQRKLSLEYRFNVAMMGSLGIGGNLNNWSKNEIKLAKEKVIQYKKIREIIQHGDQYRLLPTWKGNLIAVEYVNKNKDKAVLFVFLHSQQFGEKLLPVKLNGLISDSLYQYQDENKKIILSGKALKEIGLKVNLKGDFDSKLIILEKQNRRND
ncbi:MAG: alpha-galactosidase [Candidatus Atribacteria bacterium]|nr:alpha-galactosidase [Candidatus Atribacteria bacterium]